jgi:hypothetical protein
VLLLYDGGMTVFDSASRWDLFEIIDDRAADRAPVIISQLPIEHWHAWDRRRQWLRPLLGGKVLGTITRDVQVAQRGRSACSLTRATRSGT